MYTSARISAYCEDWIATLDCSSVENNGKFPWQTHSLGNCFLIQFMRMNALENSRPTKNCNNHNLINLKILNSFFFENETAGVVSGWASIVMGILAGCVPWFTMMIIHKHWSFLQKVDDTLGVFHTHAVAGLLGGICAGLFAEPLLCSYLSLGVPAAKGFFFGSYFQLVKQVAGALFIIVWNIISTSLILFVIRLVLPLRMSDAHLLIGDDAEHGEEAYALWGDGEKYNIAMQQASGSEIDYTHHGAGMINGRGITVHT